MNSKKSPLAHPLNSSPAAAAGKAGKAAAPRKKSANPKISSPKKPSSPKAQSPEIFLPRIPITEVFPVVEEGRLPAKATAGECLPIRATVFREGHDLYAAEAVLVAPDGTEISRELMHDIAPGLDRYEAWVMPTFPGEWQFRIESWSDPYASWTHDAIIKIAAGIDVELMLHEGANLMERAVRGEAKNNSSQVAPPLNVQKVLENAALGLLDTTVSAQKRLSAGVSGQIRATFRKYPLRDLLGKTPTYPLRVDRQRALFGSWYEIFPRSLGAYETEPGTWVSGTLRTAVAELPRIADLGFDVIYLTPISPIGDTFRKGPNNTLQAGPGDPGSPYAIGSSAGGHDEIHPDLGTFADFDVFVAEARKLDMEVALDLALQCSPDHPWVKDHPEWFSTRADGSIAYAENPPKKYQDIYPLNFDNDPAGIYAAILALILKWIKHGVTIFRVDNPHTKPLDFWERLLNEIRSIHPEVIFLAEAFTRPAMMRTLGMVGFHQSYTYFTWRYTKEEIEEYFTEVATETAHLLRPAFWPTTHDILSPFMTDGQAAAFKLRAVLAATGSPTWGIYSGYELVESTPRPGAEEQINNEKYEYRPRDWEERHDISQILERLNAARKNHPALQQLRNITFHPTTNDQIICYSKHVPARFSATGQADTVLTVVNIDPHNTQVASVEIDLEALGISLKNGQFLVRDELDGKEYSWGSHNYVDLCPTERTAHVFSVEIL